MSHDPYACDPKRAAAHARCLIELTPADLSVATAVSGALTFAMVMALDDPEMARRTANAMRVLAADLDQRAAALRAH
ncbi:MAG: hypothetical protein E6Q67_12850 [Roseateles sp.]|nr:MAG: hypothetical protein E6Q67_12850 [Roseateles sp.]